ncbi:MAG TPA: hypothetical protein VFQ89_06330 [Candidatus Binatia bacterium]|nr:hypothetical protein [Candidatus Binatia bacterium]
MRKSLILYSLLLPFLMASSLRIAAAMSDAGSNSPWNNPVAIASESIDEENGVSVDNLITIAPLFDSVISYVIPILKLAHGNCRSANRYNPPSLVTLNRTLRI